MKKFDKVVREGKTIVHSKGDKVVVMEKLDGANASISIDNDSNIECFSRNNKLSDSNTLRGWYHEATTVLAPKLKKFYDNYVKNGEFIIFGEWLVSHKVEYNDVCMKKFYPFAVYDKTSEKYMSFDTVKLVADKLGLETPKVLYRGVFTTLSDFTPMCGFSDMTKEKNNGEGIVIFNETLLNSECRTKIVSESFSEKKSQKKHIVKDITESESWISQYATDSRIEKTLLKILDEEESIEVSFKNFGLIAKPLSEKVYDDIMEEEGDTKPELYDEKFARKLVNKRCPNVLRKYIESNS